MQNFRSRFPWHAAPVLLAALLTVSFAATAQSENQRTTWRAMWANDAVFGSDNQFSNGFGTAAHGPLAGSLAKAGGTPAFGKWLAAWFLPERNGRNEWRFKHERPRRNDGGQTGCNAGAK